MISVLHTVEVKKLSSGMQYTLGKGEEFGLIMDGVFFRRQMGIVD